jgi:hypothetical protein
MAVICRAVYGACRDEGRRQARPASRSDGSWVDAPRNGPVVITPSSLLARRSRRGRQRSGDAQALRAWVGNNLINLVESSGSRVTSIARPGQPQRHTPHRYLSVEFSFTFMVAVLGKMCVRMVSVSPPKFTAPSPKARVSDGRLSRRKDARSSRDRSERAPEHWAARRHSTAIHEAQFRDSATSHGSVARATKRTVLSRFLQLIVFGIGGSASVEM